jgi:hypothetical protein
MALPAVAFVLLGWSGPVDNEPVIAVSSTMPDELNPPLSTSSGSTGARWRAAGGGGLNDEFDAKRSWFDRFSLAVPSQVHDG